MRSAKKSRWEHALLRMLVVATTVTVFCAGTVEAEEERRSRFNPFTWQESPEAKPSDGQHTNRAFSFNPLKWSNAPTGAAPGSRGKQSTQHQASDAIVTANASAQPSRIVSAVAGTVTATDKPTQPAQYEQPAVEWPAEEQAVPAARQNGQGTNPFNWTNSGRAASHAPPPLGDSVFVQRSQQPWSWSNDPSGKPKPKEILPPEEKSFNAAFIDAMKWSDHPADVEIDTAKQRAAEGLPPENATEVEMIAWEKENLPWTRPFYWSNEDPELRPQYEVAAPDYPGDRVPMIARPFKWENHQAGHQPQPMHSPSARRYPTTQAAAFLQAGESLPSPGGALTNPLGDPLSNPLTTDPFADDPNAEVIDGIDQEKKGSIAEAESLGEAPVDNSLQFLRADTVLLDPGEFQYEYGLIYSKFDLSLPIVVSTISGNVVELADFHIRELQVPLEIRYGLARRVQVFVNVPFGWANTEFSFPGFEDFENDGGLGDIIFGSSLLLRDNDPCGKPDAILTLSCVAPTGNEPFTPAGISPSSPTLGNGVWSLAANMLFIQNYDPVVVFYGFGTRQSFEGELDNRDFQPGGEYNYQFGVGFAVNRHITFSTRFNGAYVSDTDLDGVRLPGTTLEPMVLSLAMTVSKNKKLIEPFVDFGLTDDSTDARFGITWTH